MQPDEQELKFRKKARRRLVGAIALVLLMVTILPMVLDDRSANLPQNEIAISIPSQDDEDFSSAVMPVIPESVTSEQSLAASSEPEITERHAELRAEEKMAQKELNVVTETAVSELANTMTFSVQIGVFSDAGNVKQLAGRLKAIGISAVTEKIQTAQGEKIRLRAGPFASRTLAQDALDDIEEAGLSGMIVTNK